MKHKIKILSTLVLLIFTASYALPFFPQENCDMPKSNDSALHCDMTEMDCCEMMTDCVVVPFLPLTSMTLNKVELQKELSVDYFITSATNTFNDLFVKTSYNQDIYQSCTYEFHPGFQTPLLV